MLLGKKTWQKMHAYTSDLLYNGHYQGEAKVSVVLEQNGADQ